MYVGDILRTRSVTQHFTTTDGGEVKASFSAPGKEKGKHTMNMLFMYLGTEKIVEHVTQEELEQRLGDLGWRKMNQHEYDEHIKLRGLP